MTRGGIGGIAAWRPSRASLAAPACLVALIGASRGAPPQPAMAPGQHQAQPPRHVERVEVARVVVDARVVDDEGFPIRGLTGTDFLVRIDGKAVQIESVQWISRPEPRGDAEAPRPPDAATHRANAPDLPYPGRLIVFLFQKDLDESRVTGLQVMLDRARRFVDELGPGDRMAVFSFDSHLKLWADFTGDRRRLLRVIDRSVLFESPPARLEPGPFPSLAGHYDPGAGRRAASLERALLVVGRALEKLPGSKSLVFCGWGFGRLGGFRVQYEPDYLDACRALVRSRTVVFSLDVTQADLHTLEVGLQSVADATGGFYARTHVLPEAALRRLEGALAGHYVLIVEKPALPKGTHTITVRLPRLTATVLARPSFVD